MTVYEGRHSEQVLLQEREVCLPLTLEADEGWFITEVNIKHDKTSMIQILSNSQR